MYTCLCMYVSVRTSVYKIDFIINTLATCQCLYVQTIYFFGVNIYFISSIWMFQLRIQEIKWVRHIWVIKGRFLHTKNSFKWKIVTVHDCGEVVTTLISTLLWLLMSTARRDMWSSSSSLVTFNMMTISALSQNSYFFVFVKFHNCCKAEIVKQLCDLVL